MYGKRKVIPKRTPLPPSGLKNGDDGPVQSSTIPSTVRNLPLQTDCDMSTPGVTEGDSATDTELDTETEIEELTPTTAEANRLSNLKLSKASRHQPSSSTESTTSSNEYVKYASSICSQNTSVRPKSTKVGTQQRRKVLSQHDLLNKYFRRDAVVLRNIDLLR